MSVPPHQPPFDQPAAMAPFAYPLDEFYALAHRELPALERIEGDDATVSTPTIGIDASGRVSAIWEQTIGSDDFWMTTLR